MAKKKKHNRKKSHYTSRPKQVNQPASVALSSSTRDVLGDQAVVEGNQLGKQASTKEMTTSARKKDSRNTDQTSEKRVRKEVRHSLSLAGVILIGLIALWAIFAYTGVGPYVYNIFKI